MSPFFFSFNVMWYAFTMHKIRGALFGLCFSHTTIWRQKKNKTDGTVRSELINVVCLWQMWDGKKWNNRQQFCNKINSNTLCRALCGSGNGSSIMQPRTYRFSSLSTEVFSKAMSKNRMVMCSMTTCIDCKPLEICSVVLACSLGNQFQLWNFISMISLSIGPNHASDDAKAQQR